MGVACSSSKSKSSAQSCAQTPRTAEIKIGTESLQRSLQQSMIETSDPDKIRQMLRIVKKFSALLDLIGGVQMLEQKVKESVNYLMVQRQNMDIITKTCIRRAMRKANLVRAMQEQDEELIYDDGKYQKSIQQQLLKVAQTLDQLKQYPEFEEAFPMMAVSFDELAETIHQL